MTDDAGVTPDPTTEAAGETPATQPPATTTAPETGATESVEGLRSALKTERDARRAGDKRARELEVRLRELEDRDKTDSERLASRATESERRAVEAEARLLRLEVAAERKMKASAVGLLHGTTREEIEASADALIEYATDNVKSPAGFDGGARIVPPQEKPPDQAHAELVLGLLGRTPGR